MPPRRKRREALQQTHERQPLPVPPRSQVLVDAAPTTVHLVKYEISFEPMQPDPKEWPVELETQGDELHALALDDPKAAIPRFEALIAQYPQAPRLLNYLTAAHQAAGNMKKVRQLVEETYRRFPDYLFGIASYLNILLNDRKTDEAAAILGNKLHLRLLYPERKRFHISEFINFTLVVGWFLAQRGQYEAAWQQHKMMEDIDPEADQTRILAEKIETEEMIGAVARLGNMARGKRRRKK